MATSCCCCACAKGEDDLIFISLPLTTGIFILPCFLSIYITLCKTGLTNSACNLPNAAPICLDKSAILSATSVAVIGVFSFGVPNISLYNAFLMLVLISLNTKSDTLKLPAGDIGVSPCEPAALGIIVPGISDILSTLTTPSSST